MMLRSLHIVFVAGMLTASGFACGQANGTPETGKQIALNATKGNCLACHAMPGIPENVLPGNVGMPLVNVKSLVGSKEHLREHIWDETKFNPNTVMPPFGKHKILPDAEIDKVTDFIYGL